MEEIEKIFRELKPNESVVFDEHKNLYKCRSNSKASQEERRKSLLALQKEKRQQLLAENRDLDDKPVLKRKISDVWKGEIDFIQQQKHEREEWYRQTHRYNNTLMLSEWLLEVPPENFEEWIMVPSPTGKRTILVSRLSGATLYNKHGSYMNTFKCQLPRNSILDCIFCLKKNTIYVLDVIQWNGHCLRNCQTDFRFYWLLSKLQENPELGVQSIRNEFAIKAVDRYQCDKSNLAESMSRYPMFENNDPELDGLLFYHPHGFYTAGTTPLVGWLKAFMLPEVLSVPVSDKYLLEKPASCDSAKHYIEWFNSSLKKSRQNRHGKNKLLKIDDDKQAVEEVEFS